MPRKKKSDAAALSDSSITSLDASDLLAPVSLAVEEESTADKSPFDAPPMAVKVSDVEGLEDLLETKCDAQQVRQIIAQQLRLLRR